MKLIYKITTKETSWDNKDETYVKFAVLATNGVGAPIIYIYGSFNKKSYEKTAKPLKPTDIQILDDTRDETIKNIMQHRRSIYNGVLEKLDGKPEDYGLFVPDFYEAPETSFKQVVADGIDDALFEKIKKAIKEDLPLAAFDNILNSTENSNRDIYRYYCPKCNIAFIPQRTKAQCPGCKKSTYGEAIIDAKFREFQKNAMSNYPVFNMSMDSFRLSHNNTVYYMTAKENGVVLYKIVRSATMKDGIYTAKYSIEYSVVHLLGENIGSYKHLKSGLKKVDPFDALNINTKNIELPPGIIYEDSENFLQFAKKNEKSFRKLGFIDLLKYYNKRMPLETFFIVYLGIMNKYPIMEQIVKSGHANLFFSLFESMRKALNREEILEKVAEIGQLVNTETTKGKDALRFPSFIGDYLIRKNADIQEYYYWRDIAEVTEITKEQFDKMLDSFDYAYINNSVGFKDICNILKYGYKPAKLLSYIVKTAQETGMEISNVVDMLSDYLAMCELAQIEPDKFPMDLSKQHDTMSKYMSKQYGTTTGRLLYQIGTECEEYVPQNLVDKEGNAIVGVPKLFEDYVLVFPKSERDFVQEGIMQHNCVASYSNRVAKGQCVIFFLRKKESPDISYITGECSRSGLGQFYLSNNRVVEDQELRQLGSYISKKILAGIAAGKIHAISKCPGKI